MSTTQRWILVHPDGFVLKRKRKLEVNDTSNTFEGLKAAKIQPSRRDPVITREDVDQGQGTLANMQDSVSTTSTEMMRNLDEFSLRPFQSSK